MAVIRAWTTRDILISRQKEIVVLVPSPFKWKQTTEPRLNVLIYLIFFQICMNLSVRVWNLSTSFALTNSKKCESKAYKFFPSSSSHYFYKCKIRYTHWASSRKSVEKFHLFENIFLHNCSLQWNFSARLSARSRRTHLSKKKSKFSFVSFFLASERSKSTRL